MDREPEKCDDGDRTAGAQKCRLPEETDGETFLIGRHSQSLYVITLLLCYNNYGKNEAKPLLMQYGGCPARH